MSAHQKEDKEMGFAKCSKHGVQHPKGSGCPACKAEKAKEDGQQSTAEPYFAPLAHRDAEPGIIRHQHARPPLIASIDGLFVVRLANGHSETAYRASAR